MRDFLQHLRLLNRNIRFFLLATAVHGFVFFGIYALLLNLYLLRLGYGPEFIGLVNGIGPLMLAFFSVPAGLLSRRRGSRPMMIFGYSAMALSLGLLPLSGLVPATFQQLWIAGFYALSWLGGSFLVVNFSPFLMTWTGEKERSYAFALQTALFPVAGFIGSFLGGNLPTLFANLADLSLDSPIPYRNALLVAALIDLLAPAAMWQTREGDKAIPVSSKNTRKSSTPPLRLIALFTLVSFFVVMGEWTMRVYFNVYLDRALSVSTTLIGAVSAGALMMGLFALVSPLAAARVGHSRLILLAQLGVSCAFLPLIFFPHWLSVGLGYMMVVAAISLMNPTYGVFSQTVIEPQWRTMMAGSISMSFGIAIALTSFGGGFIISTYGFRMIFILGSLSAFLAAAIAWRFFPQLRSVVATESVN